MSGVAMQRSNSILPPCTISIRSSAPTMSAPAAVASSALAPRANTATRTVLPVPLGRLTDAADHLVGVARVNAQVHRDLDRLVEFCGRVALTAATASSTDMCPCRRMLTAARVRFPSFAMTYPFTSIPIEPAEPDDDLHRTFNAVAFRSFIFASAISRTCLVVTEPTTSRLGVFAPDFSLAAFFRK